RASSNRAASPAAGASKSSGRTESQPCRTARLPRRKCHPVEQPIAAWMLILSYLIQRPVVLVSKKLKGPRLPSEKRRQPRVTLRVQQHEINVPTLEVTESRSVVFSLAEDRFNRV